MKKLILFTAVLTLFACATTITPNKCPERYTPDCGIISDQIGIGGSRIFTCSDSNECRQVLYVEGNQDCGDGLYIIDRWDREEDGTCQAHNPNETGETDGLEEPTIWEPQDLPQHTIPESVREDIEDYGYKILGAFVNNDGNVLVFSAGVDGECLGLAYIAGMSHVVSMTCDQGMELYQDICVIGGYCTDDPYKVEEKTRGI